MIGRLRWLGLAGSTLLAIGGYLAGARPGPAPASQAEALWGTGAGFRVGLACYLAGLVLLGGAWWRLGGLLRAGGGGVPLRWVLVTGALWAAPLLVAPPLGSRDLYAYACQGALWRDGHDPYAVGAAAGGCPWLESVPSLWHETTAPYGPLALLASAAVVALARLVASGDVGQLLVALAGLRAVALAGALLVAAYGPRLARVAGVAPAAAAWLGLVTPLVAVHVVAGGHNDALVAGLVVAGLALAAGPPAPAPGPFAPSKATTTYFDLHSRRFLHNRWAVGAGVVLGLAVAVKVTAVVALPFALLLAAGGANRKTEPAAAAPAVGGPAVGGPAVGGPAVGGPAAGGPAVGTLPAGALRAGVPAAGLLVGAIAAFAGLTLASGLGLGWVGALADTGDLGQWTSLPTAVGMAAGYLLWAVGAPAAFDPAVAAAQVAGLVVLVGVLVALWWWAWRYAVAVRQVVTCAGVALAAVVVLGPVVYPWYAVTPLAVLAAAVGDRRGRWWLAVATLVLTALVLPSGLGVPVLTKLPGAVLVTALVLVLAALVSRAWWRRRQRAPSPPPGPPETAR